MGWFNKKKAVASSAKKKDEYVDCGVCKTEESLKLRFMQDYTRYKSLLDQIEVGKPFYINGCFEKFILEGKSVLSWESFYATAKMQASHCMMLSIYCHSEMSLEVWVTDRPGWNPEILVPCLRDGQKSTINLGNGGSIYYNFIDVIPENIRSIEAIEENGYRGIQWDWVKVLISKGFYTQEEVDAISRKLSARECKKLMLGQQFYAEMNVSIQKVLNGYVHFTDGNVVMIISDEEMDRLAG